MIKQIKWNEYDIEITRKQVKNLNFRMKPSEPNKIYISIPLRASYDDAIKLLDSPRIRKMLEKSRKNLAEAKPTKADWYETQKHYIEEYSRRLEKLFEYSCAAKPPIRKTGNCLSGLTETAYASLFA